MGDQERLLPAGSTKAFKGKGELRRRLREVEQQLLLRLRLMRELSDRTRRVRGRTFALALYAKHRRQSVSLGWRYVLGWNATWERDIEPELGRFPVELQVWYHDVNRAALILNAEERCLRYERETLKKLLDRLQQ